MDQDGIELTALAEVEVEEIQHGFTDDLELTTFMHPNTAEAIGGSSRTFLPDDQKLARYSDPDSEEQSTQAFINSQSLIPTDPNHITPWEEMGDKSDQGGVSRAMTLALGSLIASIEGEERETDQESIIDERRERVKSWLFSAAQHGLKATSCTSQGYSSVDSLIEKGKYEVPLEVIDYLSTIRRGTKKEDRKIRKAAETIGDWLEVDLTYKDAGRRQKAFESREEDAKERARKLEEYTALWTSRW